MGNGEPNSVSLKGPGGDSMDVALHHSQALTNTSGYSMAGSLRPHRNEETIGLAGLIKKPDFIKTITRILHSLSYKKTANLLDKESGIPLQLVTLFVQKLVNEKWDEGLNALHNLDFVDEDVLKSAAFMVLEQQFLDLVKHERPVDALATLRNEIVPLSIYSDRVHELSAYVTCPPQFVSLRHDTASILKANCIEKLQKLLPAAVNITERRLEFLVEQALDVQSDAFEFNNTLKYELSWYSDHQRGRNQIPSKTIQILREHKDEVVFLQFSHKGKYLASSSRDKSAVVWEVKEDGKVILKHILSHHQRPVSTISWRPDDSQLLTCGPEEAIRRWDVNSGECLHVYEKVGIGMISCGWLANGDEVVSIMTDKTFCYWDLNGKELKCWKEQQTVNIPKMAVSSDGKTIITRCRENTICLLDKESKSERFVKEEQTISSFSLSKDDKFLLVNLVIPELHLWSLARDLELVSNFKGHNNIFLLTSCFGGYEEAFIAGGSDDSQVYIWHRGTGNLLAMLTGHSGRVNSVSWHPINPLLFASASSDCTIRIWGLDDLKGKSTTHTDGTSRPIENFQMIHQNCSELIPGLSYDMARECLMRLPCDFLLLAASVCRQWQRCIMDSVFFRDSTTIRNKVMVLVQCRGRGDHLTVLDPIKCQWNELPSPKFTLVAGMAAVGPFVVVWDEDSTFLFSFVHRWWWRVNDMPGGNRSDFGCDSDGNRKVYIVGGTKGSTYLRSCLSYDVYSNCWSTLPELPTGRSNCRVVYRGGKLMVYGGSTMKAGRLVCIDSVLMLQNDSWICMYKLGTEITINCVEGGLNEFYDMDRERNILYWSAEVPRWQKFAQAPGDVSLGSMPLLAYIPMSPGWLLIVGARTFGVPYDFYLLNLKTKKYIKLVPPQRFKCHARCGCFATI